MKSRPVSGNFRQKIKKMKSFFHATVPLKLVGRSGGEEGNQNKITDVGLLAPQGTQKARTLSTSPPPLYNAQELRRSWYAVGRISLLRR
jgi:hypothetical protein